MAKYCIDCDRYIPGGICGKTGKVTGALKEMCGTKEPVVSDQQKYCSKCKRILPLDKFAKNRRHADGKQSYCKDCARKSYQSWYNGNIKTL